MAEEIVGIKIQVNGQDKILSSMGEVRKELKQAQFDVLKFSEAFGASSKEATEAAKKVALLKDAIGDAKDLVGAFNPDAKFKALSGAIQGVAGGFAAFQGALGLVGVESENVQKTLLKVQSAMALSEGLNSVLAAKDQFKNLGAVVKDTASKAFGSLKSAIVSTGIGALVIGVGLLIANFDKVKETIFGLFPGLEKFTNLVGGLVQQFTDLVGISNEADRNLAAIEKTTKRTNEGIEAKIKILTAQGGKEKEIYGLTRDLSENELKNLEAKLSAKKRLSDEEYKKIRDLKVDLLVLDEKEQKRIDDAANEAKKKADEKAKEALEKSRKDAAERAAAEVEAAKKISQLRGEAEVLGIQDEFEAKRKAIENTVAAEIIEVNKNEKIKASTKAALIAALNAKADGEIRVAVKEQLDQQAADTKEALAKQLEEENALRVAQLQSRVELLDKENAAIEYDYEQDLERLAEKREILAEQEAIELENASNNELLKFEIKKKYADERNKLTLDEVATEKAAAKAKVDIQMQYADYLQQFGTLLTQVAGKSKALAIAGIVIEQGSALAKVLMQTSAASAAATAVAAPLLLNPVTAIPAQIALTRTLLQNKIQAGLSGAGIIAGAVKGIASINSAGVPGGGGGGGGGAAIGGGTSAAAPIAPAAPIQNTVTQLDQQSISQMGSATNRAYVIESDVTNNQERIKRINRAARLT